jgi:regulator of replication initiation timing
MNMDNLELLKAIEEKLLAADKYIANLLERNEQLQGRVLNLKTENSALREQNRRVFAENAELKKENGELRRTIGQENDGWAGGID